MTDSGSAAAPAALPAAAAPFAVVRFSAVLPKAGGLAEECEDRLAWSASESSFRVAISDGASASLLAGEWADLLVRTYCGDDPGDFLRPENVAALGLEWKALLDRLALPWYAVAKRDAGAFAAFVGIAVSSDRRWVGEAIGDSCVFQVRGRRQSQVDRAAQLVNAFPLRSYGQFSTSPMLVGTSPDFALPDVRRHEGVWEPGDDLYLMTDALSEWFLHEVAQNREPWRWLEALETTTPPLSFASFVGGLRDDRKLKNDDVALIHIELGNGGADTSPAV